MYLFLFLSWIIFNANVTVEIIVLGLVFSTVIFLFMCKFMDYSVKKEIHIYKKMWIILQFFGVLIWEILKANYSTCQLILTNRYEIEPVIGAFNGGAEDIVNQNVGILVEIDNVKDLSDAMEYIRKNNKAYKPEELRKYCTERFSANVIIKKIINVYKEVIK